MRRRKFIKQCGAAGLACAVGSAMLTSCNSAFYVPHLVEGNQIIVTKSEFPAESKYVLVKNSRLPAPLYLCRNDGDSFTALLMECTHKACEVQPFGDQLHCPCHGSEFSNTGKVLEGPAEVDLRKFKVTTDAEKIYIS